MNIKKNNLDVWIQLTGMLSIVASLIFVGLEMRQSQRIAMAGQQMERTAIVTNSIAAFTEAGLDWHSAAMENRPDLTDQYSPGIASGRNNFHQGLFIYENDYFQFSQGLMPEEVWQAKLEALAHYYNQCNYRDIIQIRKTFFPSGLIEVFNSLQDVCAE